MAAIPDRLEEAIDELIAAIQAAEPGAVVQWVPEDRDPTSSSNTTELPTPAGDEYLLAVIGVVAPEEDNAELGGESNRWQTFTLAVRQYTYEDARAQLGRSQWRAARRLQNVVESLDPTQSKRNDRGWFADWQSAAAIQAEDGRGPTPAIRHEITIEVFQ